MDDINSQILEQLSKLSVVVADLKADKDRRDEDKADRIEGLHNEILEIFKRRMTPLDEMLAVLEVTKQHITGAYIDSRRSTTAKLSDSTPTMIVSSPEKKEPEVKPLIIKR